MATVWQLGPIYYGSEEADSKVYGDAPRVVESKKVRNIKKLKISVGKPYLLDWGKDTEQLKISGVIFDDTANETLVKMYAELVDNPYIQPIHIKLITPKHVEGEYVVKDGTIKPLKGGVYQFEYKFTFWRVGGIYAEYYNIMQMMEA